MKYPKMVMIRQKFEGRRVEDIQTTVCEQLDKTGIAARLQTGMRVAVTAGSRGINNIAEITRSVVEWLKAQDVEPFVVPAMGSHGGAVAEGQVAVLHALGIREEYVGAPILSSMEVVQIGSTPAGAAVWMDKHAAEADGIILVGRVKPHTDFRSERGIESGLTKMASVGLGKHAQAKAIHALGVEGLRDTLPAVGEVVLASGHILAGLAIVENGWDETSVIEGVLPEDILERDAVLLAAAWEMMPKLPVDELDILMVDQLGKDFSGTGLDTNVIGRLRILGQEDFASPNIRYIIVSDISDGSKGNALGVGLADFTTQRLFQKIDLRVMNENIITSTFVQRGAIPLVMDHTRAALDAALRCSWGLETAAARIVRIPNTLHLEYLQVSEALIPELEAMPHIEILGEPAEVVFDDDGYMPDWQV